MRDRLAAAAALALVLTACGGAGRSASDPAEPAAYVRLVCSATAWWGEELESAWAATEAKPDTNRPATIRAEMLEFFDHLHDSTDSLGRRLAAAGTPDVTDGAAIARTLRDGLAAASAELGATRARFAAIPLSDAQPAASIEEAMTAAGEQLEAVQASVMRLGDRSPALGGAQHAEPACKTRQDCARAPERHSSSAAWRTGAPTSVGYLRFTPRHGSGPLARGEGATCPSRSTPHERRAG